MPIVNLAELRGTLPKSKRLLGLDLGSKTIGMAISDGMLTVASPIGTIRRRKFTADAAELMAVIEDRDVGGLVLGLPINMDGSEGPRCQSTRQFAANMLGKLDIPIAFHDERLSTAAVERFLIDEADMTRKRRGQVIDKMAAGYILQGALDVMAGMARGKDDAGRKETRSMAYTLQQFADNIRAALTTVPGRKGREAVLPLVERALRDEAFLAEYLPPDSEAERRVLYEDPDLGFCICAHVYKGAKRGLPHDHGPTWAIYGQAAGETEMTDWRMVSPPADGKPGKVERTRQYTMRPGDAHLYEPGDIHAPERTDPTRLVRIEGENTDRVERTKLEAV